MPDMNPYSLYIHIPFCIKRCEYCDFNTNAGCLSQSSEYIRALIREIEQTSHSAGSQLLAVHTIYFGGGTPSILDAEAIGQVMNTIRLNFNLLPETEITLEANPGTVTPEKLIEYRKMGINRLSLGVQSTSDAELSLLGRIHTFQEVVEAVDWIREAKINNLNLDLIYGLPGQKMNAWQENLEKTLLLNPQHLSLYALTLDQDVPLSRKIAAGQLPELSDDLMAEMYDWATLRLEQAGFQQYEISNWAKNPVDSFDYRSLHNLQYWKCLPYLGFGAGAHGYAASIRYENRPDLFGYIQDSLQNAGGEFPLGPASVIDQKIDLLESQRETVILGLRLTQEGISQHEFKQRFGVSLDDRFGKIISKLLKSDLLQYSEHDGDRLVLTKPARLLSNRVFVEFIDA